MHERRGNFSNQGSLGYTLWIEKPMFRRTVVHFLPGHSLWM